MDIVGLYFVANELALSFALGPYTSASCILVVELIDTYTSTLKRSKMVNPTYIGRFRYRFLLSSENIRRMEKRLTWTALFCMLTNLILPSLILPSYSNFPFSYRIPRCSLVWRSLSGSCYLGAYASLRWNRCTMTWGVDSPETPSLCGSLSTSSLMPSIYIPSINCGSGQPNLSCLGRRLGTNSGTASLTRFKCSDTSWQ